MEPKCISTHFGSKSTKQRWSLGEDGHCAYAVLAPAAQIIARGVRIDLMTREREGIYWHTAESKERIGDVIQWTVRKNRLLLYAVSNRSRIFPKIPSNDRKDNRNTVSDCHKGDDDLYHSFFVCPKGLKRFKKCSHSLPCNRNILSFVSLF